MRTAVVAFAFAYVLQGCAADVWDRRVYACDEVDLIDIQGSELEVGGEDDEDDCFIEVKNLRNHELDDDVLSGNDLEVYLSGPKAYDVQDTVLVHDADGLTIEGPRGDYTWSPDDRQLDATDVDDSGDSLYLIGPIRTIVLENAGDVELVPQSGFVVLEGTARRLELETKASFDWIDVDVTETADLTLPGGEVYELSLEAPEISIETGIRTVEVDPSARVSLLAGEEIDIDEGPGGTYIWTQPFRGLGVYCYPSEGHVDLLVENNLEAARAWIDIANTEADDGRFETHELPPSAPKNWVLEPGNFAYAQRLDLYGPDATSTAFSCAPDVDLGETAKAEQMTYLVRIEDGQGRMLSCYAMGNDMSGMIDGDYGTSDHRPNAITPNACELSQWAGVE